MQSRTLQHVYSTVRDNVWLPWALYIEEKGHKGTQDIIYKKDILCPFYVPFCQLCPGQELNIVGGVREVQRSLL